MGLMDKVKNLFTEEIEEEVEVKEEPIKKETIHVEIASPAAPVEREVAPLPEPDVAVEKEEEFKFPFFDDEDFHEIEEKPKEREERKKRVSPQRKDIKDVYSPVKEEKKVFKPTPIISPVYGILDKNYQKEDIKSKNAKPRSYYNPKEATVDEIRNKAYGTLEDEIETTLFGRNNLLFDDINEAANNDMIDEIEKEEKNSIKEDYNDSIIGERPRHISDEEPELTDLLEAELGKDEPKEEAPHKISDSELFSMIDSMYQKGGKDDD